MPPFDELDEPDEDGVIAGEAEELVVVVTATVGACDGDGAPCMLSRIGRGTLK